MRYVGSALAAAMLLSGCGSSGAGTATVTPKMQKTGGAARTSRAVLESPFSRWLLPAIAPAPKSHRAPFVFGQTTAASLTSLQYYIQSIQLCESLTVNGTGYSGKSGCSEIYTNPSAQDVSLYNTYTVTEAAADTDPTHFIDFLNPTSVSTLEQPVSLTAGTYNYALINFMRPIKMTAEFIDKDGVTVLAVTKSGGTVTPGTPDGEGREIDYVDPGNTATGSAELMTYMLNNGGTWYPFLQPFVVAEGDEVVVDFVFNPNNFATVTDSLGGTADEKPVFDSANSFTFDLPYAKMAPVPRKSTEATRKEVYLVDGYALDTKVRIELYYNDADTTKAVRGVDTAIVLGPTANTFSSNVVSAMRVSEAADVVTLIGYDSATEQVDGESITGLTRRTDGTLTLHCLFVGGPCSNVGDVAPLAYTYEGDEAL